MASRLVQTKIRVSTMCQWDNLVKLNWPKEVKPYLYFSHRRNTKKVIYILP